MWRILLLTLALPLGAQPAERGRPLGSWQVEYDHMSMRMHGEPTIRHERARMMLRADGDSLFGDLVIGDSATAMRSVLRGTSAKTGWTLYVEEPPAKGFGMVFSAFGAAMDWLRATVHGIQPIVVRFDVAAKGDSLTGNRTVTGGIGQAARTTAVRGTRAKP